MDLDIQSRMPAHLSIKKIKTFSEYFNATKRDAIYLKSWLR